MVCLLTKIVLDPLCLCVCERQTENEGERQEKNERDKLRGISPPLLFSLSRLVIRFISGA